MEFFNDTILLGVTAAGWKLDYCFIPITTERILSVDCYDRSAQSWGGDASKVQIHGTLTWAVLNIVKARVKQWMKTELAYMPF